MSIGMSRSLADDNLTTTNDRQQVVIADESTGTYAGVTSDNRLKVDASVSGQTIKNVVVLVDCLKNGTNNSLIVDGSSSPVEFKYQPSSGTWAIKELVVLFGVSSDPSSSDFGGSAALTNGIDVKYTISSTTYTISNIKTNLCLNGVFHSESQFGMTDAKWIKDTGGRYYMGTLDLESKIGAILLNSSNSDKVSVFVNDNLTTKSLLFFRVLFQGSKEI